jgi:hypothetical protein
MSTHGRDGSAPTTQRSGTLTDADDTNRYDALHDHDLPTLDQYRPAALPAQLPPLPLPRTAAPAPFPGMSTLVSERSRAPSSHPPATSPLGHLSQPAQAPMVASSYPPPAAPAPMVASSHPPPAAPYPSSPAMLPPIAPPHPSMPPAEVPPWVPPAPRQGVSLGIALGAALLTAAAGFVAGWFLKPGGDSNQASASASASAAEAPRASAMAARETTRAQPRPSARVTPDTSAAPTATPKSDDVGAIDVSKLLSYEGYLLVRSDADAEVFVNGVNLGRTNAPLVSRCFQKFVRLRDQATERWLTEGTAVKIACMEMTEVRIDPRSEP